VATATDVVRERGLRVCVGGVPIGIYLVGDDYHAMEDTCPHAGSALSEGELEGPVIRCPTHGWDYDVRTGFKPGHSDGFPIPCFPVRVEEGMIWIDIPLRDDDEDGGAQAPG